MKSILFRDQVLQTIQSMNTTVPLDIALAGVSISQATVIDASDILWTLIDQHNYQTVDFGSLKNVIPPAGNTNLFVEFAERKGNVSINSRERSGVHIVPYSTAGNSMLFSELLKQPLLDLLTGWASVYVMIIYHQIADEFTTLPVGMIIGISQDGSTSHPGFFKIVNHSQYPYNYNQAVSHMALIAYSTLECFALLNCGDIFSVRVLGYPGTPIYRLCRVNNT